MAININDLGPSAQKQVLAALEKEKKSKAKKEKTAIKPMFESKLEAEFYQEYVYPLLLTKDIINVETHKTFLLLEKDEYRGIRLPKAEYTPDFILTFKNGEVEVVEVKHKKIRQLQQSYVYRRRLFIDKYCRPNGWRFVEWFKG